MPAPLTIGAVVRALAEEFPDVTVSKVRFLEAEGLVTPERTDAGYRRYTHADVDRLRYVLRAQRDLFWPLKVIKDALAATDRGLVPGAPGEPPRLPDPEPVGEQPDPGALHRGAPLRLTSAELVRESGLAPGTVEELVEQGLLRPRDGLHGPEDLDAARAVVGLLRHGLEIRHLRTVRNAADRESDLVDQAVSGLRGAAADQARTELLGLTLALHDALVRSGSDAPG